MANTRFISKRLAFVLVLIAAGSAASAGATMSPHSLLNLTELTLAKSVNTGSVIFGSVRVNSALPAARGVTLKSNNPAVASVQASTVIPPGSVQSVPFQVRGVSPGCTWVSATLGNSGRTGYLVVHPAPGTATFSLNVPESSLPAYANGMAATGTITNAGSPASGTASLTSSNPAAVSVPPSVAIVRGRAVFTLLAHNSGCVTITATIGGQSVRKTVQSVHIGG